LNERGYLLLPLRFDLLPQRLLDFPALLDVPRFKPSALLRIQLKTRVTNRSVGVARENLPSHILALTHEIALLRSHLHPKLGIPLEILTRIRGHCQPAISDALP
jgi:hypothetical protein